MIAEKNGYTICLSIDDGSTYKGKIEFSENKKLIKVKTDYEIVWFPMENISHYSIIYNFSKDEKES